MMAERIQQKLKICTGHDWREVKPSYINFRLRNNKSRPQMCVFSPDDITKQRARLFIPEDARSHELHRPDIFLEKYLNVKQAVVKNMPWVKFDLDEFNLLPNLTGIIRTLRGTYTYTIKITGDVKLRKITSANNFTLSANSFRTLSVNTKMIVCNMLMTLKASYDDTTNKFSYGASVLGEQSTTSLRFTPPDTLTGEVTPSINVNKVKIKGYEIETHLGYSVSMSFTQDKDTSAPLENTKNVSNIVHDLTTTSNIAVGILATALIIFSAPEILLGLAVVGVAASVA